MKTIFNIITNKYVLLALIAVFVGLAIQIKVCSVQENERLATYNRQLSGQLTEQEHLLQSANHELGIANSRLVTQKQLADELEKAKLEVDKEFEAFKKEHNLVIASKDLAIARLEQQLQGSSGTTVVPVTQTDQELCLKIEEKCVIGYTWADNFGRFSLIDPNIFKSGDEIVTINQYFRVLVETFKQQDGSLMIQRLVLREVYPDGSGGYKEVPNGKAEIVEHEFVYDNAPIEIPEWSAWDLFKLRMVVGIGTEIFPEPGDLRLSVGLQFFGWRGLGVNSHTGLDFDDPKNIAQYLAISYAPEFDDFKLNIGLEVAVGTFLYKPFDEYSVKVGLMFYLW